MSPLKNAKQKGNRQEYRTRAWIQKTEFGNWKFIRAAGSLGPADLVGLDLKGRRCWIIQVKSNRWPGTDEMARLHAAAQEMRLIHRDDDWRIMIYRWDNYQRKPKVRRL